MKSRKKKAAKCKLRVPTKSSTQRLIEGLRDDIRSMGSEVVAQREAIERLDRTIAALGSNSLTLQTAPPKPTTLPTITVSGVEPSDSELLA